MNELATLPSWKLVKSSQENLLNNPIDLIGYFYHQSIIKTDTDNTCVCGLEFDFIAEYEDHMMGCKLANNEPDNNKSFDAMPLVYCELCAYEPFLCVWCGRKHETLIELDQHILKHMSWDQIRIQSEIKKAINKVYILASKEWIACNHEYERMKRRINRRKKVETNEKFRQKIAEQTKKQGIKRKNLTGQARIDYLNKAKERRKKYVEKNIDLVRLKDRMRSRNKKKI